MNSKYAFILPDTWTKNQIAWFQETTANFRPDQVERVWHLMHSWGCQPGMIARDFFRLMRRAVKNTLNNLP